MDINTNYSCYLNNVSLVGRWLSLSTNECTISFAQFRASSAENVIPMRILRLITRGSLLFCHILRCGFLERKTDLRIRVLSIGTDEIPFSRNFA